MSKRFKKHLYTIEKIGHDSKGHLTFIESKDETLFSDAIYPTKIKASDLPEWYVHGRFYKRWGYLCAKGVVDIKYRPSKFSNHLFKDDFLFISYSGPLTVTEESRSGNWYGSDDFEYVYGFEIIDLIKAIEKYSDLDVSEVKKQINDKIKYWNETYADGHHVSAHDIWD